MRNLHRESIATLAVCLIALGANEGSAQDANRLQAPPPPAIAPPPVPGYHAPRQYPLPPQAPMGPNTTDPAAAAAVLPATVEPPYVNITPQTQPDFAATPGSWTPGGFEGRVGRPYYYSAYGMDGVAGVTMPAPAMPGARGYGFGLEQCGCGETMGIGGASMAGMLNRPVGIMGQPMAGQGFPAEMAGGDVYSAHFGPGYHRHTVQGHYRFPYYSYRRPWYFQGPPSYNRDTNLAW